MHELGYCESVLEAVERRAAGRRVAAVCVRIGAVHRVAAEAFQQAFTMAAAGGPAADAVTTLVVVPVHGLCRQCRRDFESPDPSPACPLCGSLDVAVEGGTDIVLEWLQYRDLPRDLPRAPIPAHSHVGGT